MPVIHTYTSARIPAETRERIKGVWGKAIESVPGKSETWLMCIFEDEVPMYHAGSDASDCAYVTVDVYARTPVARSSWEAMTPIICDTLESELGIDPARIYVRYGESANFGWNGMNF